MLKYKDFFLISTALAVVACAPQRATFTLPSKKDPSQSQSRQSKKTVAPPDQLELKLSEGAKSSLVELVAQLDENAATHPTVGMYRTFKRKNPVTKRMENRKQEVTEVTEIPATETTPASFKVKARTTDLETGTAFAPRELDTNELDPIEKGLRKLAEGDAGALYSAIAAYLSMYYGMDSIPQTSHVVIDVKSAMFVDHLTFKLSLRAKLVDNNKPGMAFEARLVPELPRPFNIVYLAWGAGSAANQPVLEITDFGPVKPEGLTLGNATTPTAPAQRPAQETQITPALIKPPKDEPPKEDPVPEKPLTAIP